MKSDAIKKRLVVALLIISVTTLINCSGKKIKIEPEDGYIFFPPLPNEPRYQYLTTFSDSGHIEKKKSKLFKFVAGADLEKPKTINKPYGIAIFEGIIYVCDIRSNAVVTLDLKERKFGYMGDRGQGKLIRPVNVIVDRNDRLIFVTDMGRKQVLSYNLNGKFLKAFGKKDELSPSGMAMDEDNLFISDVKKNQIAVMNKKNGEILFWIGKSGHDDGELFHPSNICIHDKRLYVSDMTNFRISIFDLKGKFLESFGKIGVRPGTFTRPKGIAVDNEGRIYVVDSSFENVQVFNDKYQLLLFMFNSGTEKHNINLPAVITIDYDNLEYFRKYISPDFRAEYLLFVTSNFGKNKVNVYAFGTYEAN